MKEILGLLLAFSVCSNVWLWVNLWNLNNEHFRFSESMTSFLKEFLEELSQQPPKDCSCKCSEQSANEV